MADLQSTRPIPINSRDLTGQRHGRLLVLRLSHQSRRGVSYWQCQCDCGTEHAVAVYNLVSQQVQSCGCLARERCLARLVIHGESHSSAEYRAWTSMKQRCYNPRVNQFYDYGGRGITVCAAWRNDYLQFLRDVGRRPSSAHSLDRIDVDGNYEPGNVRWATHTEQRKNQRTVAQCMVIIAELRRQLRLATQRQSRPRRIGPMLPFSE